MILNFVTAAPWAHKRTIHATSRTPIEPPMSTLPKPAAPRTQRSCKALGSGQVQHTQSTLESLQALIHQARLTLVVTATNLQSLKEALQQQDNAWTAADAPVLVAKTAALWSAGEQGPADGAHLRDVLPYLHDVLAMHQASLRPREAVRCASALGTLRGADPGLVLRLAEGVRGQLGLVQPAELASLARVLAGLGVRPGNAFLGAFMPAVEARLNELDGPMLASLLHSLVSLGVAPPVGWLAAFDDASRAGLQELDPASLASLAWAGGQVGWTPGAGWAQGFLIATRAALRRLSVSQLSDTLWGVSRMKLAGASGPEWAGEVEAVSQGVMGSLRPSELVALLSAVASLGYDMGNTWVKHALHHTLARLPACSPRELAELLPPLTALARRAHDGGSRSRPRGGVASGSSSRAMAQPPLPHFALVPRLSPLLAAVTTPVHPSAAAAAALPPLPALSPSHTPTLPRAWMREYLSAALPLLPRFTAQSLARMLACVVEAGGRPSPGWLAAYGQVLDGKLAVLGGPELCTILVSMAALRYRPARWLQDALLAEAATKLSLVSDVQLVTAGEALVTLGVALPAGSPWVRAYLGESSARAARLSGQHLARIARCVLQTPLPAPPSWWAGVTASVQPQLGRMGAEELGEVLWSVSMSGVHPGQAWMEDMHAAVSAQLEGLPRPLEGGVQLSLHGPRRSTRASVRVQGTARKSGALSNVASA